MTIGSERRRGSTYRIALGVVGLSAVALLAAGPATSGGPAGDAAAVSGQSSKLPAVPPQALDPYLRAHEIIDVLDKRPDQAAGSAQWDVVIKRLMEAQALAPRAPLILLDLGLANQLRGRSSAAAAWLKAAVIAIERANPDYPDLPQLAKRISWLMERPSNQVELALTFAKGEIPFIHAQTLPDSGVHEDIWPPRPTPPMGPVMVKLPNGQVGWNPMYYNPDGTPKAPEVSAVGLQEFLVRLKLGIGDESGIEEAVSHFDANYSDSVGIERSHVRVNAYNICLQSLLDARSWAEAARLAGEAAEWCRNNRTAWTDGQDSHFRDVANDALGRMQQAGADNLGQWIALAKELAASDDEIYFDAKIDRLRQLTVKGEALMEGLAGAVRPIGHNLMRLRSIAD